MDVCAVFYNGFDFGFGGFPGFWVEDVGDVGGEYPGFSVVAFGAYGFGFWVTDG